MEDDSIPVVKLSASFAKARGAVFDPPRLVAVELQNITDVLVELLKEIRLQRK